MQKTFDKFIFLALLISCQSIFAQAPSKQDSIWQRNYQKRIRQSKLYGVYIPQNLGDAHNQLNKLISKESKEKFRRMTEDQVRHKLFFSLGRWIIYNWGFYDGSRLSDRLRKLGIYHPEDMAEFIIITYHRKMLQQPLNAKELIEQMTEKRKKEWEKRHKVTILPKPKAPN